MAHYFEQSTAALIWCDILLYFGANNSFKFCKPMFIKQYLCVLYGIFFALLIMGIIIKLRVAELIESAKLLLLT